MMAEFRVMVAFLIVIVVVCIAWAAEDNRLIVPEAPAKPEVVSLTPEQRKAEKLKQAATAGDEAACRAWLESEITESLLTAIMKPVKITVPELTAEQKAAREMQVDIQINTELPWERRLREIMNSPRSVAAAELCGVDGDAALYWNTVNAQIAECVATIMPSGPNPADLDILYEVVQRPLRTSYVTLTDNPIDPNCLVGELRIPPLKTIMGDWEAMEWFEKEWIAARDEQMMLGRSETLIEIPTLSKAFSGQYLDYDKNGKAFVFTPTWRDLDRLGLETAIGEDLDRLGEIVKLRRVPPRYHPEPWGESDADFRNRIREFRDGMQALANERTLST